MPPAVQFKTVINCRPRDSYMVSNFSSHLPYCLVNIQLKEEFRRTQRFAAHNFASFELVLVNVLSLNTFTNGFFFLMDQHCYL